MVGRGGAARGVGGGGLLGEGGFARCRGEGDRPARAGRFQQEGGEARRKVARRFGFGAELDHAGGEADEVDGMDEMAVQRRLAAFRDQGGDLAERGEARSGRRFGNRCFGERCFGDRRIGSRRFGMWRGAGARDGTGGVHHGARAIPSGAGRGRRGRRGGGGGLGGEPLDELAGRGQVGDVAEADQHHLGGLAAVRRGLHLAHALEQHLPEAAEHRHRELVGQRAAADALGLGQVGAGAQRGDRLEPGERVGEVEQIAEQQAEIGAAFMRAVGDGERVGGPAGEHRLHQVEHRAAIGEAEHVGDGRAGDRAALAGGLGDRLVEQGHAVAGGAVGGAGDEVERLGGDGDAFRGGHLAEKRGELGDRRCGAGRSAGSARAP